LLDAQYPLQGTSDHGVSEAIYVADPDGNGVELTVDHPPETWPRAADGSLAMGGRRKLDVNSLLALLEHEAP
jgi:catechol 2,3-dioxygenase